MLDITHETDVYTAHDQHVGTVDRIVLDPRTRAISHVVVRKGVLFREDRLVPIGDIATATAQRINLRRDVGVDDLLPYVEQYYEPLSDDDRPRGFRENGVRFAMPLSGALGETMPAVDAELVPVNRRNIPDRLTALETGVPVFAADHHEVGRLDGVVSSEQGLPTHVVVESGGLMSDRRELPIEWVRDIGETAISLEATREAVEAVAPLSDES